LLLRFSAAVAASLAEAFDLPLDLRLPASTTTVAAEA
jgi:hypothetical protein